MADFSVNGKVYPSPELAIHDIAEGASVLIAGFGGQGTPEGLIRALQAKGVGNLNVSIYFPDQRKTKMTAKRITTQTGRVAINESTKLGEI